MLWNAYTIYLNLSDLVRLFHMQGVKVEYKRGDPSSLLLLGVTMGRNVPWSDKKKVQDDRKTY